MVLARRCGFNQHRLRRKLDRHKATLERSCTCASPSATGSQAIGETRFALVPAAQRLGLIVPYGGRLNLKAIEAAACYIGGSARCSSRGINRNWCDALPSLRPWSGVSSVG